MRIIASDDARELIAERGGRLYVSVKRGRCCGGLQTLDVTTEAGTAPGRRSAARPASSCSSRRV